MSIRTATVRVVTGLCPVSAERSPATTKTFLRESLVMSLNQ